MSVKKERLYYLDLIKCVALVAVFVCHFTRSLEGYGVGYEWKILPDNIFGLYMGSFGVTLFFIASGASLMYVYDENINVRAYYKKRLLGIYPMFWIAFALATCISFFVNKGIDHMVPKWKIIYSVLGIDGNALWWGPNFYQLGEWFLSVIICLYIIFPVLRLCVKKTPKLSAVISVMILILCVLFFHTKLPVQCFFLSRIAEFVFGMIYMKYRKKTSILEATISAVVLIIMLFIPEDDLHVMFRTFLVGICSFYVLSFLFQKLPMFQPIRLLANISGKYCYAFFLTHHYILQFLAPFLRGETLVRSEVILMFVSCSIVVCICTRILYRLNQSVVALTKCSPG